MKFKSAIFTQVSGSIGGITFFQSSAGLTARARAIPLNPATPFQEAVRLALSFLASRWADELAVSQRAAWNVYGDNVTLINDLGDPFQASGINHYIRSNTARRISGFALVDDGPVIFNLGNPPAPTDITFSQATQDVSLDFPEPTPTWFSEDGAFGFGYMSRPQSAGINFFIGPYRLATPLAGDSGVPLTTPITFAAQFPFTTIQNMGMKLVVSRADGRLSTPFRDFRRVVA